ncbi:MAG: cyclic nucleotide-binding domain-containing protein [Gammaproteobacteria bacterium]|nr:cyclic nucleotide-binding domain-containing protein [Gammaproteobacteria bacterium]MBU1777128.1 cyclic nucleotide-binding domain-containing protein [Gammaproteobacteria bacterium]MBU1968247.1 cyclic nucleotide-binding domain-containing protein [Gammaproteobacteria bacterium]
MQDILDIRTLAALEPISSFSPARLRELLDYCHVENVEQGRDPFKDRPLQGQSVYLLRGELEVEYVDGNRVVIRSDSEWARHPIGKRQPEIRSAQVLSPQAQLLRVADDLLDRIVTWDQFVYHDDVRPMAVRDGSETAVKRLLNSGMFSAENLSNSPFAHLPSANIGKLLNRIEAIAVWDKDVIIREGDEGDYYYLIESGRAQVTRLVGGANLVLADLKTGDVFGEEALISDTKRNATVTMKSNGVLLRLKKQDFLELLQEPLLHRISYRDAKQKVAEGAVWLDVRHPPEYRYDKLPGAINVPLNDIRNAVGVLNKMTPYIAYCQSGRRSAAAAFILAQAGYNVYVLENGLWSVPKSEQQ